MRQTDNFWAQRDRRAWKDKSHRLGQAGEDTFIATVALSQGFTKRQPEFYWILPGLRGPGNGMDGVCGPLGGHRRSKTRVGQEDWKERWEVSMREEEKGWSVRKDSFLQNS